MNFRLILSSLLVFAVTVALTSCGAPAALETIQVVPGGQIAIPSGQQVQFKAIGSYHHTNQSSSTKDVTNQVTWASTNTSAVTISATGLATAVASGSATITADLHSSSGDVTGNSNLTVTGGGGGGVASDLISISIIPATSAQLVNSVGETTQYIAIGTFGTAPTTQDLTDQVIWQSSDVKIATIDPSGLATAMNAGNTTITASASAPNGAFIAATSDLTVGNATTPVQLPTLTIYKVGANAATGIVTNVIPSQSVINCGVDSGCTGHFTSGETVILQAAPATGTTFGGWSQNCSLVTNPVDPSNPIPACSVQMVDNQSVGAIFD